MGRQHQKNKHWLSKQFPNDNYLVSVAIEMDFLKKLVSFIKNTEFVDNDLATYFDLVEDTELNFRQLTPSKGFCGRVIKEFKHGKVYMDSITSNRPN